VSHFSAVDENINPPCSPPHPPPTQPFPPPLPLVSAAAVCLVLPFCADVRYGVGHADEAAAATAAGAMVVAVATDTSV